MSIFIDPPAWAAHGTVFSHLISNSSVDELHSFAARVGVSKRAFDIDHYDIPRHHYRELVNAGAQPVSGSELTRILIASGLRVPFKERPRKIRPRLLRTWAGLLPGAPRLGEELLERWEQPHRAYHNSAHLAEMLEALGTLYSNTPAPRTVQLATWFHDAVYNARPGEDEAASAHLARTALNPLVTAGRLAAGEAAAVVHLVELTASHVSGQLPKNAVGYLAASDASFFLDADMAILAAGAERYRRYVAGVRSEYSHYDSNAFAAGRRAFLAKLLGREHIFISDTARAIWEQRARNNIGDELKNY